MSPARFSRPSTGLHTQVEHLYGEQHGWLSGWLRKKLGCAHRAADVAQDTFLRLLSREEPICLREPRAFLTTVAQRVMANLWRREQLEKAYLETLLLAPQMLAPSVEERAIQLETLLAVDRLLAELPAQVRQVFLRAQVDGMGQAEIAEAMGISVSTVKRHLMRATAHCYFAR